MVSDSNKFVLIRSEGRVSVGRQFVLRTASTYQLLVKAPGALLSLECKSQALMRLPLSHIVVYQGCATFITEGPNAVKQIRPRAAPSFHTGCLVLVTGIKIHFVVLHLARGPQVAHPCRIL